MTTKLYHRRPQNFRGEHLYPLNRLRDIHPDLYAFQAGKYRGREELMRQRVPFLNCLWNDVLQFSPVHPAKVKAVCQTEGLEWLPADWFEFDPGAMGFDATNTVIFMCADDSDGPEIPESDFVPYSLERLAEMREVPQRARDYVREVKRTGGPHFIFMGIPHVQHVGALDTRQMRVIRE